MIGRGAMMFLVAADVKGIYGRLMSKQALSVCPESIYTEHDKLAEYILNRQKVVTALWKH